MPADRVEVQTGDARQLLFADASFELVVSTAALHNIYEDAGCAQAVQEIARVLKQEAGSSSPTSGTRAGTPMCCAAAA
jgi:ubiquinone/menaquinone biosynthesis C-methylase UbiE